MPRLRHMLSLILPPLATLPRELTLLVLMDGNERAKRASAGGYRSGGRKLLELCRHLERHPRVVRVVACVLSQENISKRPPSFFGELHEALVDFGAAMASGALEG